MKTITIDPKLKDYLKYCKTNDIKDLQLNLENKEIANYGLYENKALPLKYFHYKNKKYYVQNDPLKLPYGRYLQVQQSLVIMNQTDDNDYLANAIYIIGYMLYTKNWRGKKTYIPENLATDIILNSKYSVINNVLDFFLSITKKYKTNIQEHCFLIKKKQMFMVKEEHQTTLTPEMKNPKTTTMASFFGSS